MKRMLIVDDEAVILDAARLLLSASGVDVTTHADPIAGQEAALAEDFDLIVLDLWLGAKNGAELTEQIKRSKPEAKILITTGDPSDPLVQRALAAGAIGLLKKPFQMKELLGRLESG